MEPFTDRAAKARDALQASFYPPENPSITLEEREHLARVARSAHYRELGRKSGEARRRRREELVTFRRLARESLELEEIRAGLAGIERERLASEAAS